MKKILLISALLLATWGTTFLIGVKVGISGSEQRYKELSKVTPSYTGQQIQDAVNQYRISLGLIPLEVDSILCNNLFDRYAKMLSDDAISEGHPGFNEWADEKINTYHYSLVGEVFSPKSTVESVMVGWKGSPGHNLAITNKEYSRVCTYAGSRGVVMVLGAK